MRLPVLTSMNRSLFILLLLAFLCACTVQKRLHRPGWHVSWNKNYKQNKGSEKSDEAQRRAIVEEVAEASYQNTISNNSDNELDILDSRMETPTIIESEKLYRIDSTQKSITIDNQPSSQSSFRLKKNSNIRKTKTELGRHHILSIVFFVLFLLSILAIIAIVYNISIGASLSGFLFFLFAIFVLIVLGFLFLIGSLIALFSHSVSKTKTVENKDNTESKSPSKEQAEPSETEIKKQEKGIQKSEKTSKNSDIVAISITAIAAVLFFLLLYN